MDPPFTKLDLLSCRNLLIYLDADLQKKLLPLFHYSLNPGGTLLLGGSETIGAATDLFAALPGKNRIYRRRDDSPRMTPVEFPIGHARGRADVAVSLPALTPPPASPAASLQAEIEALLLRCYAPRSRRCCCGVMRRPQC